MSSPHSSHCTEHITRVTSRHLVYRTTNNSISRSVVICTAQQEVDMPHELEVLAFTFQGRAVEYRGTQKPQSVAPASPTQTPQSVTAPILTQTPHPDPPANGDEDDMTRKTVIADRV